MLILEKFCLLGTVHVGKDTSLQQQQLLLMVAGGRYVLTLANGRTDNLKVVVQMSVSKLLGAEILV